jgi:pimeloyl-ACP methyl ester carboxylesterase
VNKHRRAIGILIATSCVVLRMPINVSSAQRMGAASSSAASSIVVTSGETKPDRAPPIARKRIPPFVVSSSGRGRDVILIPGLGSAGSVWDATKLELQKHHRVHVIQLAGFAGLAPNPQFEKEVFRPFVDLLATWVKSQKLRSPMIIGHSFGGEAAIDLAARYPTLVGPIMVVDALPFLSLLIDAKATSGSMRSRSVALHDQLLGLSEEDFAQQQKQTAETLTKTVAKQSVLVDWSVASDRATFAGATRDLLATDLRLNLKRITSEVHVLYAYDPKMGVPVKQYDEFWQSAFASANTAKLRRVDNSFHFIMWDQEELFLNEVRAFVR